MFNRLPSNLTYANVVATIALFLSLGGGLAWALATNSVKSKHIKDGQVKNRDLSDAVKPQAFTYAAATGDNIQEEILDHDGYRVLAACNNVGGRPEVEFFLELPEDGRMVGLGVQDPSDDDATAFSGPGLEVVGGDVFSVASLVAPASEQDVVAVDFTYTGSSQAAVLDLHAVADDDADLCRVAGVLTRGVIPPA